MGGGASKKGSSGSGAASTPKVSSRGSQSVISVAGVAVTATPSHASQPAPPSPPSPAALSTAAASGTIPPSTPSQVSSKRSESAVTRDGGWPIPMRAPSTTSAISMSSLPDVLQSSIFNFLSATDYFQLAMASRETRRVALMPASSCFLHITYQYNLYRDRTHQLSLGHLRALSSLATANPRPVLAIICGCSSTLRSLTIAPALARASSDTSDLAPLSCLSLLTHLAIDPCPDTCLDWFVAGMVSLVSMRVHLMSFTPNEVGALPRHLQRLDLTLPRLATPALRWARPQDGAAPAGAGGPAKVPPTVLDPAFAALLLLTRLESLRVANCGQIHPLALHEIGRAMPLLETLIDIEVRTEYVGRVAGAGLDLGAGAIPSLTSLTFMTSSLPLTAMIAVPYTLRSLAVLFHAETSQLDFLRRECFNLTRLEVDLSTTQQPITELTLNDLFSTEPFAPSSPPLVSPLSTTPSPASSLPAASSSSSSSKPVSFPRLESLTLRFPSHRCTRHCLIPLATMTHIVSLEVFAVVSEVPLPPPGKGVLAALRTLRLGECGPDTVRRWTEAAPSVRDITGAGCLTTETLREFKHFGQLRSLTWLQMTGGGAAGYATTARGSLTDDATLRQFLIEDAPPTLRLLGSLHPSQWKALRHRVAAMAPDLMRAGRTCYSVLESPAVLPGHEVSPADLVTGRFGGKPAYLF